MWEIFPCNGRAAFRQAMMPHAFKNKIVHVSLQYSIECDKMGAAASLKLLYFDAMTWFKVVSRWYHFFLRTDDLVSDSGILV